MSWLRAQAGRLWAAAHRRGVDGRPSVLDAYCPAPPDPQNALDIFAGEWASRLPPPFDTLRAGQAHLFDDGRVHWAIERLGGVRGRRILELGPLEGGHTYMLDRAGAAEVMAIESNTRAYVKCLIAKELVGMPAARFVCGDFVTYLRDAPARFDVVFASGVLYHMVEPVEVLARIAGCADAVFLWTHYYDADVLGARADRAHRVVPPTPADWQGFAHQVYRHEYLTALGHRGFCGGSRPFAHWLTRDHIVGALRHFGLTDIEVAHEQPDHPNGPAFSVLARRERPIL